MKVARPADHRGEFFRVLQQTERTQTAIMTIGPGRDAGPEEIHEGDQIIYIVEGRAVLRVEGHEVTLAAGDLVTIPPRARHHVKNPASEPLFFLTVYSPPEY